VSGHTQLCSSTQVSSTSNFGQKFEKMAAASPNPLRSTEGWDLDRWVEVRDEP
jgi:hypothetical protein